MHFNQENTRDLDKFIRNKKSIFLLIYMEGCRPCMEVKPEWSKIENTFKKKDDQFIIGDIERQDLPNVHNLNYEVKGFPTILFLDNGKIETFEDAGFQERKIDTFMKWINSKYKKLNPKIQKIKTRKHRKPRKYKLIGGKYSRKKYISGGKWSRKYKKKINCNKPKGFSQRQYCIYGRH
jgi:hypothetical protein